MEEAGKLAFNVLVGGDIGKLADISKNFDNAIKSSEKLGSSMKKFNTGLTGAIKGSVKGIVGMAGIIAGSAIALDSFVSGTINMSNELEIVSKTTGIAKDALQQLAKAGQGANKNLTFNKVIDTITNIQTKLNEIKLGKGDAIPFMRLGINPIEARDAIAVIEKLRKTIHYVPPRMKADLLKDIGLTPEFIKVLELSDKEYASFRKRILTPIELAGIEELGRDILKVKNLFKDLKDKAVAETAPYLMEPLENISEWIEKNERKVIGGITETAKVIGSFAEGTWNSLMLLGNALSGVADIVGKLTGSNDKLQNTKLVLLGISAIVFPKTTALIAIIGALDQIQRWRKGEENSLEKFLGKPEDIQKKLEKIKDFFKPFAEKLEEWGKLWISGGRIGRKEEVEKKEEIKETEETFISKAKNTFKKIGDVTFEAGFSRLPGIKLQREQVAEQSAFHENLSPPTPISKPESIKNITITNNITVRSVEEGVQFASGVEDNLEHSQAYASFSLQG